jgi:glycosyltransferase involved in cell wall biosynthesis
MRGRSSESRNDSRGLLVSVVVPTRDRPEALKRCLTALAAQTVGEDLEVILVDDGSAAVEPVAAVAHEYRFVRLISQRHAGPAAARNTGVRHARGEYVCFTDDDCEPSPIWAEALMRAIDGGADAVAGQTLSANPSSPIAAAAEIVAHAPAKGGALSEGALSFAPTNNIACRAGVVAAVGFDEHYPTAAAEDRDWCARLLAAGYVLRAEPSAELVHRPDVSLRGFLRQQVRYGRGSYQFRARQAPVKRIEAPSFYIRLIGRGFQRGLAPGLFVLVAQLATAIGYLSEWSTSRASSAKVAANPLRNRGEPYEVMDDVERQGGNSQARATSPSQHAVEGVVEHED